MSPVWSFAKISCLDITLLNALSAAALRTLSEFDPLAISKISWACAVLELSHQTLRKAISSEALARMTEFAVQDRTNMAWAFADFTLGLAHWTL